MENVKVPENKNLTPDGSFKTKDGRTTLLGIRKTVFEK